MILGLEDSSVKWHDVLRRASLLLGLISLVLAIWAGTHLQHLLDNGGSRHAGETLVAVLLTLLLFAGPWYGVRSRPGT